MKNKFVNRCELPNNSLGKFILCRDELDITLYGRMELHPGVENKSYDKAKKFLILLTTSLSDFSIDSIVGNHKEISHQGEVLGGTQALVKDGQLFLYGSSTTYGEIHPEAVERCLHGKDLRIESLGLTFFGNELLPLEQYLSQEVRNDKD